MSYPRSQLIYLPPTEVFFIAFMSKSIWWDLNEVWPITLQAMNLSFIVLICDPVDEKEAYQSKAEVWAIRIDQKHWLDQYTILIFSVCLSLCLPVDCYMKQEVGTDFMSIKLHLLLISRFSIGTALWQWSHMYPQANIKSNVSGVTT